MLKLRKVAVTGGLACGKSTVCHFFKKFGAFVVHADDIVHRLLSPQTALGQQVVQLIGGEIIINNQIDRSKIAEKVFNQPSLLQSLEKVIHPAVQEEIENLYEQAIQQEKGKLFVAEVPLLFEAGLEGFFDTVITVVADPAICRKRYQATAKGDLENYDKRIQRQWDLDEKARRANFVIKNNSSLQDLEAETKKLMNILTY